MVIYSLEAEVGQVGAGNERSSTKGIIIVASDEGTAGVGHLTDGAQVICGEEIIRSADLLALRIKAFGDVIGGVAFFARLGIAGTPDPLLNKRPIQLFLHAATEAVVNEAGDVSALSDRAEPVDGIAGVGLPCPAVGLIAIQIVMQRPRGPAGNRDGNRLGRDAGSVVEIGGDEQNRV